MSVLVLGAGGFLGLHVVDALDEAGVDFRAGRRKRSNVLALRSRRAPMVEADLDDPESLDRALQGVQTVVHAAGHYPRLSLNREASIGLGVGQLDRLLDAAARAGVRRLVYLSSTATVAKTSGRSTEAHRFPAPPSYGVYHDLKWLMEARVEAEDRMEVVTVCPGACLGAWDLRVGTSALLVGLARGLDPEHPDGVVNIVDARDVGAAVLALVRAESPPRRVLLGGSNHQLHSLLTILSARYRVPAPRPPLAASEAIRLADEEERRCARGGGRPSLSREIVDLVVHGTPIDGSLATRLFGLAYRPLSATLDYFDDWARRMRFIPPLP